MRRRLDALIFASVALAAVPCAGGLSLSQALADGRGPRKKSQRHRHHRHERQQPQLGAAPVANNRSANTSEHAGAYIFKHEQTIGCYVAFFTQDDFGGTSTEFHDGAYHTADATPRGFADDAVSSFFVSGQPNCYVTLYGLDGFRGWGAGFRPGHYTCSEAIAGGFLNDDVSSFTVHLLETQPTTASVTTTSVTTTSVASRTTATRTTQSWSSLSRTRSSRTQTWTTRSYSTHTSTTHTRTRRHTKTKTTTSRTSTSRTTVTATGTTTSPSTTTSSTTSRTSRTSTTMTSTTHSTLTPTSVTPTSTTGTSTTHSHTATGGTTGTTGSTLTVTQTETSATTVTSATSLTLASTARAAPASVTATEKPTTAATTTLRATTGAPAAIGVEEIWFVPTKLRGGGAANSVQISEIEFMYDGRLVDLSEANATNSRGNSPNRQETPAHAIDGSPETKWVDFNKGSLHLVFKGKTLMQYFRFRTANDYPERDPIRWNLHTLAHSGPWTQECPKHMQKRDYNTTTVRLSTTPWFPFSQYHCHRQ